MTSSLPYHSTPMQSAVIWDSIFSSDKGREGLLRQFLSEIASNVFHLHYAKGIKKKRKKSPVILDLCLRKTRSKKSQDKRIT